MRELGKHLRIYGLLIKNSAMQQLEYRANFFINVFVECLYLCSKLLYVMIAYRVGSDINGVSAEEIKLFVGTFILLTALYTGLFMDNFYAISGKVRRGDLDVMLVKPLSARFYVTCQKINIALPVPNLIGGTILVATAWKQLEIPVNAWNILIYLALIGLGLMMTYALFLLPQILCFYVVKTDSIVDVADKLWDFNNMPMSIYGKWMQRIGTFIIPVFVIVNFPVLSLLQKLTRLQMVWAVCGPVLFYIVVKLLWDYSIRHYSSAGG